MVALAKTIMQGIFAALLASNSANAMMPLKVVGKRFIKPSYKTEGEGEVFFIKGIDYQPGGSSDYSDSSKSDVLSDEDACLRDAFVLQQLGANTIRIYTVNPAVNHDKCMSIFDAAGIYVIVDVNSPLGNQSLNRDDPSSSYNYWYIERVFKVIDAFKNYPNLIGFFSGNEVINNEESSGVDPPYLRAVQRDMKQYIAKNANRTIPVGYSAADVVSLRKATWEYFNCNEDGDENDISKADFFGLNSYEWCSGTSDWSSSGYSDVNSTFSDATIPVFFSEYGCNKNRPRTFDEVSKGVFGGLVKISSGNLKMEKDFDNLKSEYAKSDVPTISLSDVKNATLEKCKSGNSSGFDAEFTLPSQPGGVANLIKYGVNNSNIGSIVSVSRKATNYTITAQNGSAYSDVSISIDPTATISTLGATPSATSSSSTSTSATKSSKAGAVAAAAVPYGSAFAALACAALSLL